MNTVHEMKLNDKPFERIKMGEKNIEMRLYDEKRQLVKPGHLIEFCNQVSGEKILTKVIGIHIFAEFETLYQHFDKISLGYLSNETANSRDMEKYYTPDEQQKYGVVGIEIALLKANY